MNYLVLYQKYSRNLKITIIFKCIENPNSSQFTSLLFGADEMRCCRVAVSGWYCPPLSALIRFVMSRGDRLTAEDWNRSRYVEWMMESVFVSLLSVF